MNFLLDVFLTGFGLYSIFHFLIDEDKLNRHKELIIGFDLIACYVFAIAGLFYLFDVGKFVFEMDLINKLNGPFFWFQPILYLTCTQLMWFKKMRSSKWLRLCIGLVMLISFEKLVIYYTSLHHDYGPIANTSLYIKTSLINWTIYLTLFIIIIALVLLLKRIINEKKWNL